MKRNVFQIAVFFALIALIIKLVVFSLGVQHGDMEEYIRYAYMLLVLTTVFLGIRFNRINKPEIKPTLTIDFKTGARSAAYFALIVGAITYFYYANIDTEFFSIKKAEILRKYAEMLPELIKEKGVAEVKKSIINNIQGMNAMYTPYSQASYTFFALLFLGMVNSAVFSFMMKKIPGFK